MRLANAALLILPAAVALAALKAATDLVAASALLLTLGVLAASLLGIPKRPWIGFALFGWGYLAMVWNWPNELPTTALLQCAYLHVGRCDLAGLDEPIAMNFQEGTPIQEVMQYIKGMTGIQYYLEPNGYGQSEKTTAPLVLDAVPLRTTLALVLDQVGMGYRIQDGFIRVASDPRPTAFSRIGHCCFALLAGSLGAAVGRRLDVQMKGRS